jgi:cysteine desulfurase
MHRIYLDHAATSPLDPEVQERMADVQSLGPMNPSSPHREGRTARKLLQQARDEIQRALGLRDAGQVIFTRGGTEANHLVIWGRAMQAVGAPLAFSAVEHSSVRGPMEALARRGHTVHEIGVTPEGVLDPAGWQPVVADGPRDGGWDGAQDGSPDGPRPRDPALSLISVQAVNSETGLVLQSAPLLTEARRRGIPVHVDAVQGIGRVPLRMPESDADAPAFLTLSAHKLGGPPSVGVLIRDRGVALAPTLFGGGQEQGIRPGTEDVVGAVGAARAIRRAMERAADEVPRLTGLRDRLQSALVEAFPGLRLVAPPPERGDARAPHILMVLAPDLPRDLLPGALDLEGVAVSAGSACRSGAAAPSPALLALLGDDARRVAPVRFSLGTGTLETEIDEAVRRVSRVFARIPALHGALA